MANRCRALVAVCVLVALSPATARGDVDATGTWVVYHDHFFDPPGEETWELTQSGTSLTLSINGGTPGSGTIDPGTGFFSVDMGPAPGGCGLFASFTAAGQVNADGETLHELQVDAFGGMCTPVYSSGVGTRCVNSPVGVGEECITPEAPLFGRRLTVRDKDLDPARRKIVIKWLDAGFTAPDPGSVEDPRGPSGAVPFDRPALGGARLTIARGSDEVDTIDLPAAGWTALGSPAGSAGYRYFDRSTPCFKAIVRDGIVRVLCKGAGIGFTLDEVSQGELSAFLQFGRIRRPVCSIFGGTVLRDTQATMGRLGAFRAKNASAPVSCEAP